MTPFLGPLLWTSLVLAAPPTHRLEVTPAKEIEAVLTQEYSFPKFQATEWVVVIPKPLDLPCQDKVRSNVEIAGSKKPAMEPRGLVLYRLSGKEKQFQQGFQVQARYSATLFSRRLIALDSGEKPPATVDLKADERREWLKSSKDFDWESKDFQQWLTKENLRRQDQESDVDLARRIFLHISTQFKYHYAVQMDRAASAVCRAGKSDCGGLSGMYVSALRANQVPARTLAGRWALSAKKDDQISGIVYYQVHVKAEFFADGIGWVPVDMAGGVQQGDKAKDLRYFGNDKGDFLVLGLPVNHVIDVKGFDKLSFRGDLQGSTYWGVGKGTMDPVKVTEDWKVEAKSLLPDKK
ncbi:MAG: transglutaminase domain-containing protein [Gemmataceae bacterium]|nr:transglutaminase domain-containing protein [Gemmataceae bacterium]